MATQRTRLFGPTPVGIGDTTLYTAPSLTTATFSNITFSATTTSPCTLTIHMVPSGGSVGTTNIIALTVTVDPKPDGQYVPPSCVGLSMSPGDSLHAICSVDLALNATGSGVVSK